MNKYVYFFKKNLYLVIAYGISFLVFYHLAIFLNLREPLESPFQYSPTFIIMLALLFVVVGTIIDVLMQNKVS